MATQFTGLLGDLLGYMQDPNRTQALQGVGGLLQSGLTSMDESQAKFRDLQKRAFGDKKNPMKVTDQAAFDQLTEMTMSGPMAFAPVGMTKAVPQAKSLLEETPIVRTPEAQAVIDKFGQKQVQEAARAKKVEKMALESASLSPEAQAASTFKSKGKRQKVEADYYRKMAEASGDEAVLKNVREGRHLKQTAGGYVGAPRTVTSGQG